MSRPKIIIPRDFLERKYVVSNDYLEEVIKNIKTNKDIFNGLIKKHSIVIADTDLPFQKISVNFHYLHSTYSIGLYLIFVKYVFDDHVSMLCVRSMDDSDVFSGNILYNAEQKMMPKMEHIGSIIYSLLVKQKIEANHLYKYVRRLPSKDYGRPLSDITIVLTNNEN